MNTKAKDRDSYIAAMRELASVPIIGTHTIGKLTIECSMRHWKVTDGSNTFGGGALKGGAMRNKVSAAVDTWMDLQFGKQPNEK